jgi:hypothetical protein
MTITKAPGAQFEISIDGTPRTYRDRKPLAIEAAEHLQAQASARCRYGEGLAERRGDRS